MLIEIAALHARCTPIKNRRGPARRLMRNRVRSYLQFLLRGPISGSACLVLTHNLCGHMWEGRLRRVDITPELRLVLRRKKVRGVIGLFDYDDLRFNSQYLSGSFSHAEGLYPTPTPRSATPRQCNKRKEDSMNVIDSWRHASWFGIFNFSVISRS